MLKLIIICFFCVSLSSAAKIDCNRIVANGERCVKEALFMGNTAVPHTANDWKSYSKVFSNSVKCVKKMKQCVTGLQRQMAVYTLNGVTNYGKYLFGKNANVSQHLHAIQCFDSQLVTELQQCLVSHSTRLQYISKTLSSSSSPAKNVIAQLCCSMRMSDHCSFAAVNRLCKVAKAEAIQFMQKGLKLVVGEAAELMCSKQSSFAICENQFADVMKSLRAVDPSKYESDEFILRPMFRISQQLSL